MFPVDLAAEEDSVVLVLEHEFVNNGLVVLVEDLEQVLVVLWRLA